MPSEKSYGCILQDNYIYQPCLYIPKIAYQSLLIQSKVKKKTNKQFFSSYIQLTWKLMVEIEIFFFIFTIVCIAQIVLARYFF